MPELPEVEAARRLVERACVGRVVEDVLVAESGGGPRDGLVDDIVLADGSHGGLREALVGRTLSAAGRVGKVMHFRMGAPADAVTFTARA